MRQADDAQADENADRPAGTGGKTHNRELMRHAREALSGHWGAALGIYVIYIAISMALSAIPFGLGNIASLIVSGPLIVGFSLFFLVLSRQQDARIAQLFSGFERFGTTLAGYLLYSLFLMLWALPGIIVMVIGMVVMMGSAFAAANNNSPDVLEMYRTMLIATGIALPFFIPAFIAQLRYGMTFFILADDAIIGPLQAIRKSKEIMSGNKWKYFCLTWRFFWWSLLCIPTLGIGLLWLGPYVMTSQARFYDDVS